MGMITLKKQSAASVSLPATDQLRLFVDSADDILKTKDDGGVVRPSGVGTADELATTGAPVDVSASAPPVVGHILSADSPVSATWKAPTSVPSVVQTAVKTGPASYNAVIDDLVRANVAGGIVAVSLPTAIGKVNREIWVKLVSAATFACTITPFGAQTIDGDPSVSLTTNYEWIKLRSDGANWMQVG
jgi:hypothetical protein